MNFETYLKVEERVTTNEPAAQCGREVTDPLARVGKLVLSDLTMPEYLEI